MRFYIIAILLITFVGCGKPAPTYNPFDGYFDVSVTKIVNDNCDTISADCGFFNLTKNKEHHQVYYQVFMDEHAVCAKGMVIPLTTLKTVDSA
ncbi:MAG: hypothetical protein IIA45_11835 [Bacteroidetes bacterium]|nr:hypothetical protein [Bacteroidota bacterium]